MSLSVYSKTQVEKKNNKVIHIVINSRDNINIKVGKDSVEKSLESQQDELKKYLKGIVEKGCDCEYLVKIKVNPGTRMNVVTDIKYLLSLAGLNKILYE